MRKKGLVERIVIGEAAESDFSTERFPKNRKRLFLYLIKNKLSKIYKNHLLTALFFLPLICWAIMSMGYSDWFFNLEAKEGLSHLVEYWFTTYVTAIPLWVLAFVGLSGGLNVIRKLAWSDPLIIKTDFFKGIKLSGKQMAIIGLIWGVLFAILRYFIDWLGFYYRVFDDSYSVVFGIFVCIFLILVLIGITSYACCMASIYNVTFKELILGAFKLYFADFFMATGVIILCLLPFLLLNMIGLAITTLISYLISLGLGIGVAIIPPFLVCQHTFDRVINKKDYPGYYGRGLSYGVYNKGDTNLGTAEDDYDEKICDSLVEDDFERVEND